MTAFTQPGSNCEERVKVQGEIIRIQERENGLLQQRISLDSTKCAEKEKSLFTALESANNKVGSLSVDKVELTDKNAELTKTVTRLQGRTWAGRVFRKARDGLAVGGGAAIILVVVKVLVL